MPASRPARPRSRTARSGQRVRGGLPAAKRSRTRPRTSATRPAATEPAPSSRAIWELIEILPEEFEEAAGHVLARHEFAGWRFGPVRPLPADRLLSGSIGWVGELEAGGAAGVGSAERWLVGWLYLVVTPNATSPSGATNPLVGVAWESLTYAADAARAPHTLLAARTESEVHAPLLRRFAEELRAELDEEAEE